MLKTAAGAIIGNAPRRFLRIRAVSDKTGLPASTVYAMMASGLFPKSIPIGLRCKAWLESEVEAWQEARIAERGGSQ